MIQDSSLNSISASQPNVDFSLNPAQQHESLVSVSISQSEDLLHSSVSEEKQTQKNILDKDAKNSNTYISNSSLKSISNIYSDFKLNHSISSSKTFVLTLKSFKVFTQLKLKNNLTLEIINTPLKCNRVVSYILFPLLANYQASKIKLDVYSSDIRFGVLFGSIWKAITKQFMFFCSHNEKDILLNIAEATSSLAIKEFALSLTDSKLVPFSYKVSSMPKLFSDEFVYFIYNCKAVKLPFQYACLLVPRLVATKEFAIKPQIFHKEMNACMDCLMNYFQSTPFEITSQTAPFFFNLAEQFVQQDLERISCSLMSEIPIFDSDSRLEISFQVPSSIIKLQKILLSVTCDSLSSFHSNYLKNFSPKLLFIECLWSSFKRPKYYHSIVSVLSTIFNEQKIEITEFVSISLLQSFPYHIHLSCFLKDLYLKNVSINIQNIISICPISKIYFLPYYQNILYIPDFGYSINELKKIISFNAKQLLNMVIILRLD
jgi:hypothetical protein